MSTPQQFQPGIDLLAVTPQYGWTLPVLGDSPNVPYWLQELALDIEATVKALPPLAGFSEQVTDQTIGTNVVWNAAPPITLAGATGRKVMVSGQIRESNTAVTLLTASIHNGATLVRQILLGAQATGVERDIAISWAGVAVSDVFYLELKSSLAGTAVLTTTGFSVVAP